TLTLLLRILNGSFYQDELNGIDRQEVEHILAALVLDGKVQGRIDQVNGLLVLRPHKSEEKLVGALNQWTHSLEKLRRQLHDKLLPEAA
ncbi:hypothetical protein DYB31_005918, partial [Aphanomyces astaci]